MKHYTAQTRVFTNPKLALRFNFLFPLQSEPSHCYKSGKIPTIKRKYLMNKYKVSAT